MYYVNIKGPDGQEISVEVSFEVYQLFEDERRELERERFERRAHWDRRGLDDYIQENTIAIPDETVDLVCLFETLRNILLSCTPLQRMRFVLYMRGYSLSEIAKLQKCSVPAVLYSLNSVIKKIRKSL